MDPGLAPAHTHSHTHSHEPAPQASGRLRRMLAYLLAPFLLAAVVGVVMLWPSGGLPESTIDSGTPTDGTITAVATGSCAKPGEVTVEDGPAQTPERRCLTIDVELTEGAAAGNGIRKLLPVQPATPRFAAGDDIVLAYTGGDPASAASYQIKDFQRGTPLLLLAGLFALAVLALGRWQGLRALLGLGLTFAVLALFVLPAILDGGDPLLVAVTAAGLIMFVTLYLTHGFSARTTVAVLGTLVSLGLIGVTSAVFSAVTRLTGLDEPTATLIGALGHGIDARGLLLAGVVIGALGVLDDVTVTQASAVWELRQANPDLGWRELYGSALRIGRDHVASAVNTLVLAYAGAALPVLLYTTISGVGLGSILGSQDIAQEILRTLAGSLGIIAAVPVTTVLAALVVHRELVK
ncbi:MAG: YibE/F family protein [Thermocrispum sp.]